MDDHPLSDLMSMVSQRNQTTQLRGNPLIIARKDVEIVTFRIRIQIPL